MNCEGCEFELFEGMGPARLSRVGHIQIATHLVPPPGFSGNPAEQIGYSVPQSAGARGALPGNFSRKRVVNSSYKAKKHMRTVSFAHKQLLKTL